MEKALKGQVMPQKMHGDISLLCKQQGSAQVLTELPLCRTQDRGAGEPSLLSATRPGAEAAEKHWSGVLKIWHWL